MPKTVVSKRPWGLPRTIRLLILASIVIAVYLLVLIFEKAPAELEAPALGNTPGGKWHDPNKDCTQATSSGGFVNP